MKLVFFIFLIIALLCNLIWISWTDIKSRLITNRAILLTVLLILPFSYILWSKVFIVSAAVTLLIGFILFMLNVIGAGDVKLLSVLMLAVPSEEIMPFLFLVTVVGAVIAIMTIVWLLFHKKSFMKYKLSYGVAICGGFILNFAPYILSVYSHF